MAAGCATEKVDWQARTGNYTYDQAVTEYGPPARHEKFPDGTVVAEWVLRAGRTGVLPSTNLAPPNGFGPAMPAVNSTYAPASYMRLTFGPDGQLLRKKDFTR